MRDTVSAEKEAKAAKKKTDFVALWVSRQASTMQLLHDCHDLTVPDEFGRKIPLYMVVHRALAAYKVTLATDGGTVKKPRRTGL